jgi:hypothetical protein
MSRRTTRLFLYMVLTLGIGIFTLGAAPAHANKLLTADATVSCTGYTVSFTASDLFDPKDYTITWTITLTPTGGGAPITITNAVTGIDGVGNTGDDYNSGALTFSLSGLTGPYTLLGTATLSSADPTILIDPPATIAIGFTNAGSLSCAGTPSSVTGRFTGGGKQVEVDGLTITKGLELDCDRMGSNNLEINWQDNAGAHQFHMENFTFANCFLNPAFSPTPPNAPINTMIGVGTGRFDNSDGYTVEFTLEDHGEPGRNDQAGFKIYLTANPSIVVLNFPLQALTTGNLQAHPDQH